MKDFKDLKVWCKAHDLTLAVYRVTRLFPRDELYGLSSQLRRAAGSIGANIADGCGRRSGAEFVRFLQIARGSASELEYHLLLARDLEYIPRPEYIALEHRTAELQRMLTSLVQTLRWRKPRGNTKHTGGRSHRLEVKRFFHSTEVKENSNHARISGLAASS